LVSYHNLFIIITIRPGRPVYICVISTRGTATTDCNDVVYSLFHGELHNAQCTQAHRHTAHSAAMTVTHPLSIILTIMLFIFLTQSNHYRAIRTRTKRRREVTLDKRTKKIQNKRTLATITSVGTLRMKADSTREDRMTTGERALELRRFRNVVDGHRHSVTTSQTRCSSSVDALRARADTPSTRVAHYVLCYSLAIRLCGLRIIIIVQWPTIGGRVFWVIKHPSPP